MFVCVGFYEGYIEEGNVRKVMVVMKGKARTCEILGCWFGVVQSGV